MTDTQSSIGAVQEAGPAPGTQQYRSHSSIDDSIKYRMRYYTSIHLLYSQQVPDGPENRANCRISPPKPRQCPRSKSDHSNQRQREQGEGNCAASYQVNRVLGQHHLNIIHGFKTLNVNGPLSSDQHPHQQQGPLLQSRPPLHRFHKFN